MRRTGALKAEARGEYRTLAEQVERALAQLAKARRAAGKANLVEVVQDSRFLREVLEQAKEAAWGGAGGDPDGAPVIQDVVYAAPPAPGAPYQPSEWTDIARAELDAEAAERAVLRVDVERRKVGSALHRARAKVRRLYKEKRQADGRLRRLT